MISITFFTEPDAMNEPADARESTAITTPPLYRNASVVVPWFSLMRASVLVESTSVKFARKREGCVREGTYIRSRQFKLLLHIARQRALIRAWR